tara:strand:- start:867 stop:1202 length:336 start_codon:yes stop_codon:yes gene_type:complete
MTNLIHVDVDTSELEAKFMNEVDDQLELVRNTMQQEIDADALKTGELIDALTAKIDELTTTVENLEECLHEEAQLPSEEEGSDMLAKFMTRDEINEFVKEILREAPISIDV